MTNEGIGIGETISYLRHVAKLTSDQLLCVEILIKAYEDALKEKGEK
jgi:TfoX/Sxy family transcriptional regulator of competence genes